MSKYSGKYFINGADVYDTYGMVFEKGAFDALLKFPQTKDGYTEEWQDQTGTDYLAYPETVLQSMSIDVPFILLATDKTDFFAKYNQLRGILLPGQYFVLEVADLNMAFKLRYTNMSNFTKVTKLNSIGKVCAKLTFTLQDDFPDKRSLFRDALSAARSQGYTVDENTFEQAIYNLSYSYRKEAAVVLAPGIYKSGAIAGVDTNGNIVPFTFSRAGTATYIDKNGIMQTAAANMPRIDYSEGKAKYLIENASTNLCPYSSDFTHWQTNHASVSTTAIKTQYGRPLYKLSHNDSSTGSAAYISCGSSAANTNYYYRITLRGGSVNSALLSLGGTADPADGSSNNVFGVAGDTMKIISGPGTIAPAVGAIAKISGLSQNVDTIVVISRKYVSASIPMNVYLYADDQASTNANAFIYASTAQLEVGGYSSQIDTNGAAVTRVADVLSSVGDIVPYQSASLYADFTFKYQGAPNVFVFGSKNSLELRYFMSSNGTAVVFYDASNSSGTTIVNNKYIALYDASGKKIANGGVVSASSSTSAHVPSSGNFTFNTGAGGIAINIRAMVIFVRKLADAEAVTLTT